MSAVASAEFVSAPPVLEVVAGPSAAQLAEKEMYRWMLWLGLPSLVAAFFVARSSQPGRSGGSVERSPP